MVYFNYILIATVVSVGCWFIYSVLIGPMFEDWRERVNQVYGEPVEDTLTSLLIKPDGVEAPVFEICQAILGNLGNGRFRFKRNPNPSRQQYYWILDKKTKVRIQVNYSVFNGRYQLHTFIEDVFINKKKLELNSAEKTYVKSVMRYVGDQLTAKPDQYQLRLRRNTTKLYSQPPSEEN